MHTKTKTLDITSLALLCVLLLPGCAAQRNNRSWDNIDYQRAARSRVYEDNDSSYRLPSVVSCDGPDDDVANPTCR